VEHGNKPGVIYQHGTLIGAEVSISSPKKEGNGKGGEKCSHTQNQSVRTLTGIKVYLLITKRGEWRV